MTQELRGTVRLTVEVPLDSRHRAWRTAHVYKMVKAFGRPNGFLAYNDAKVVEMELRAPSGEVSPMEVPEHWRKR